MQAANSIDCCLVFIPGKLWSSSQQEICKPSSMLCAAAHQPTGGGSTCQQWMRLQFNAFAAQEQS
jgi:hypothetical protein